MVGDFQQSIYGRRADLKQSRQIHQALLESAGAYEKLEFSVTFRLDQKQVDCVNKIFKRILNSEEEQVSFIKLDPRPEVLPGQIMRLDLHADDMGEKAKMRQKADAEATQLANWLRGSVWNSSGPGRGATLPSYVRGRNGCAPSVTRFAGPVSVSRFNRKVR